MGHVNPEVLLHELIADDRRRNRMKRLAEEHDRIPFNEFLKQCGIADLGELNGIQALCFIVARNLASAIDLMEVPSGRMLASDRDQQDDITRPQTSINPALREYLDNVPDRDFEFEVLNEPEDIPDAVPEDLLLRRLAPREFLRRLTEGELLRSAWVHQEREQEDLPPENPEENPPRLEDEPETRPLGYLLLDASESMGTSRDLRNLAARGLAIAFLWSQRDLGNPTWVYLFRHVLGSGTGGENQDGFEDAIARVLIHAHVGMTNLQDTLENLSTELLKSESRVDIVLITDGLSHLTQNPLSQAHLHTFLLGERPEEFDKVQLEEYKTSKEKLKSWSEFLFLVPPEVMAKAAVPERRDLFALDIALESLSPSLQQVASVAKTQRIRQRAQTLVDLYDAYLVDHSTDSAIIERRERALAFAAKMDQVGLTKFAIENTSAWPLADRELAQALESREIKSILDERSRLVLGGRSQTVEPIDFFAIFRAVLATLRRLVRRR